MNKQKKVICLDRYRKRRAIDVSELVFRPSVYGILIEGGNILLSPNNEGKYDFPGGGMEVGETVEVALLREFREETGLQIRVGQVLACQSQFYKIDEPGVAWNVIAMFFACHRVGGELSDEYFDNREKSILKMAEWISLDDVGKITFANTHPNNLEIIEKARRLVI